MAGTSISNLNIPTAMCGTPRLPENEFACKPEASALWCIYRRYRMSRAYRPRLSKDRAVAQRVGAELERERLHGYSVSRQTAAVGTPDSESPNSPKTTSPVPALAPPAPPAPPLPPEEAVDAIELRDGPSREPRRRSSTPTSSSNGSLLRPQRNSKRDTTATEASSRAAAATARSPVPTTRRLGLVDSSLGRSPSPHGASRNGWPCVSCSFLNVEAAKKCRMCNTRHCQPRPTPPSPPVAVAAPAEGLVDDADDEGACGSAVRACSSTDLQGRRGGGVRELRSPRGSPSTYDAPSSARRRRRKSNGFAAGDIGAGDDADAPPVGGKSTTLAAAIDGRSSSQDNLGRNGADGSRAADAGAGESAGGKSASATGAAPASAGTTLRGGKRRSQAAATAAAAALGSAAAVAAAAMATFRTRAGMSGSDNGDACRSLGLPSPSPLPPQKRSRKRSRAPPPIALASAASAASAAPAAAEAAEAPLSPSSSSAAVALLQGSTGADLTADFSGGVIPSLAGGSPRRAGSPLGPAPGAKTNDDPLEPPMPTTQRRAAKTQRQNRPPFVVTPLTNDGDEPDGRQGVEVTKGATSVAASMASTAGEDAGACTDAGASTGLASVSPSRGASARGRSWPTAARVASLNFSRGGAWRVSSVTVTVGDRRRYDAEKNEGASVGTAAAAAAVVVCHSGGVSVWHLTDAEAVCRYISPALASGSKESARGRFFVAAVVGSGDVTEVVPFAARMPRCTGTCIVAIGRHGVDPGLPVIRVWQGSPQREGRLEREDTARDKAAAAPPPPPVVLTTTVKKKISSYFPPVVPRHVAPCLCLCGYSTTDNPGVGGGGGRGGGRGGRGQSGGGRGGGGGKRGGEGEREVEVEVEEVTAVMALGGKVVRLICAAARSGSEDVKAKSLPTGSVGSGAVCTSLAPVPTNPFLVWASFPSSNAILLWDVRELRLLFTLPLTSSSVCVPTVASLWPLSVRSRGYASVAEGGDDGLAPADGSSLPEEPPSSLSSPTHPRRPRHARRDPRLLCLLATGSRGGGGGGGCVSGGGSGVGVPTRPGCGLFGVCRAGSDGREGAPGCSSTISAIRLEAVAEGEESPRPACSMNIYSERRRGSEDETSEEACLTFLCEGDGFVAGVDKQGRVVVRDLLTGEPHVLFTAESANNTRGGGGAVASMDGDRRTGVFAVATGDVGGDASNFVDIYTLSKAGGDLATGLVGDVRAIA